MEKKETSEVKKAKWEYKGTVHVALITAIGSLITAFFGFYSARSAKADTTSLEQENKEINKIIGNEENVTLYREFPVGSIIFSMLDFNDFSKQIVTQPSPSTFDPSNKKFQWSPADGRDVTNSVFHEITSKQNLPDLRGLFLRNVNDYGIDHPGVEVVSENQANPENKSAGEFQEDAIISHQHKYIDTYRYGNAHKRYGDNAEVPNQSANGEKLTELNENGAEETRPKNMTVYYYIKIN